MTTPGRQIPDDYRKFYYLEDYLFNEVRSRFHEQRYLSAEDFFCIVIWKANRAKSKVAERLLSMGKRLSTSREEPDLSKIVEALTAGLANQKDCKERLRCLLCSWGFRLPMASAILTVLYPEDFTVYDGRVCDVLDAFHNLTNLTNFESVWRGYMAFKRRVEEVAPQELSLRDKDRWLWGRSFYEQLKKDIAEEFKGNLSDDM